MFKKCVEATGDPQHRSFLQKINRLTNDFMKCVESQRANDCLNDCLKRCRGKRCGEVCLGALKAAMGTVLAKDMIRTAEKAASLYGLNQILVVAWTFKADLEKVKKKDCPEKEFMAWILATAAIELYEHFKKVMRSRSQDVILLMAPALAEAYQCVGEEVFKYLDFIKPVVGERAAKRIAAALKEGNVFVGGEIIQFKPVKSRPPRGG